MALVDDLIKDRHLITPAIISAFKTINRDDFLLPRDRGKGEIDAPLQIGHKQTISQPLTVAFMLERLQPKPGDKVLDIGSGSGWTTALLAEIVGEKGRVFALELIPELMEFGKKNADKYDFVNYQRVKFITADGWKGLPARAPFDSILVSAAAPEIPAALLDQLRAGGRLVMPVGDWYSSQDIVAIEKLDEHKYKEERFPGFVFVPLVKRF